MAGMRGKNKWKARKNLRYKPLGNTFHSRGDIYGAYKRSLALAVENSCHSIVFPLISAGILNYTPEKGVEECDTGLQ